MSTIKADAITAATGTNTNLSLTGKGTGTVAIGDDTAITGTLSSTSTATLSGLAYPSDGGLLMVEIWSSMVRWLCHKEQPRQQGLAQRQVIPR